EYGRSHEIVRITPPSGRCTADDELVEGITFHDEWCRLRGLIVSRADSVYLHIEFAPLRSEVSCEHLQPAFGSGISGNRIATKFAHHRANIDNFSRLAFNHSSSSILCHNKWTHEVDVDHPPEVVGFHFRRGYTLYYSRVVYQDVYRAHLSFDEFHVPGGVGIVSYVKNITMRSMALVPVLKKCAGHLVRCSS